MTDHECHNDAIDFSNAIQITDDNGDYIVSFEVYREWVERQLCAIFGLPASYWDTAVDSALRDPGTNNVDAFLRALDTTTENEGS